MRIAVSFLVALVLGALVFACGGDDGKSASDGNASGTQSACERGCMATLAADCANGPETQAQCVSDCEALEMGICGSDYAAFQECAEGESIGCSTEGIPAVEACAAEQSALIACLNAG